MTLAHALRQATDLAAGVLLAHRFARHDAWPRVRLLAHQRAAFRAIVRHAAVNVPF